MTAELDRLDLELRSIPGVVAVGLDHEPSGLVVQVVVIRSQASPDVRDRVRRSITANVRESVNLEVVLDAVAGS
jgi:hypothetical protein